MQIVAGLQMGIAGIPWWTTDIGGFHGGDPDDPAFRELLVRWFQYGTFCPVMRLHGDRKPQMPVQKQDGSFALSTGGDNEVWSYGTDNFPILKKYLEFREKMRPYTRQLMQEAHEQGTPVIRTMFYEFPDDEKTWDIQDAYMFGPDLLVAPITAARAENREVYLPACDWTNLHTGERIKGGKTVCAHAPIDVIPLFLRNEAHREWIGALN
jgi:alpha-D-xyloside xylohydrolase